MSRFLRRTFAARTTFVLAATALGGCFFFQGQSNNNQAATDLASSTPSGKQLGLIEISGARNSQTSTDFTSISAAFFTEPSGCTEKVDGACTIKHCPPSLDPIQYRRAGQLTIAGGARNYSLAPTDSGAYGKVDNAGPPFAGGDKITLTAAGDLVPAFSIEAVAPFQIVAEQPKIVGGALSVSASKPLALAWSGSPGGDVLGVLTRYSSSGEVTTAYCRFAGEAGTGQLPQAVVQTVAQAVGDTITFGMISRNQTTKLVGGYSVQLNLTFAPTNVALGAVTFVP